MGNRRCLFLLCGVLAVLSMASARGCPFLSALPLGPRSDSAETAGMRDASGSTNVAGVSLSWAVVNGSAVRFQMSAPTTGWVGVGWTSSFGMIGSDAVIGWVSDANTSVAYASDAYLGAYSYGCPDAVCLDADRAGGRNDAVLLSASQVAGVTTIEFMRPVAASDSFDRALVHGANAMVFAYGSNDGPVIDQHSSRGSGSISLTLSASESTSSTTNSQSLLSVLDGRYVLEWNLTAPFGNETGASVRFRITSSASGYAALGFPVRDGVMIGADSVIGWWDQASGVGVVDDYYLGSKSVGCPGGVCLDSSSGGLNSILNASVTLLADGRTVVEFSRMLIANDARDRSLVLGDNPVLFAVASGDSLQYHGSDRGSAVINLSTGESSVDGIDPITVRRIVHGVLMTVAWCALMPAGTLIAALLKHRIFLIGHWWFRLHVGVQSAGLLLTFIAFVLSVEFTASVGTEHFSNTHARMGLAVMIFTLLVPSLGVLADHFYQKGRRVTPVFPDLVHWLFGYVSILFAYMTVLTGLVQFDAPGYAIGLVCVAIATFYFLWALAQLLRGFLHLRDGTKASPKDIIIDQFPFFLYRGQNNGRTRLCCDPLVRMVGGAVAKAWSSRNAAQPAEPEEASAIVVSDIASVGVEDISESETGRANAGSESGGDDADSAVDVSSASEDEKLT
jgi:hypothetical protein